MNFEEKIRRKIETASFAENNGRILRTINVLRGRWIRLSAVKDVLADINAADLEQSLIYLEKANYITARRKDNNETIEIERADYTECEVSLTDTGIKVAVYIIKDDAVKV